MLLNSYNLQDNVTQYKKELDHIFLPNTMENYIIMVVHNLATYFTNFNLCFVLRFSPI